MRRRLVWLQLLIGWLPMWAMFVLFMLAMHDPHGEHVERAVLAAFRLIAVAALLAFALQWLLEKLPMPVLVLMGDREVLCNPDAALARARRHIPDIECDLVQGCSHDMCFSKREIVDRRVLEFLRGADTGPTPERERQLRQLIGV